VKCTRNVAERRQASAEKQQQRLCRDVIDDKADVIVASRVDVIIVASRTVAVAAEVACLRHIGVCCRRRRQLQQQRGRWRQLAARGAG